MEKKPESFTTLFPAVFAEFVASAFLILIACGAAMSSITNQQGSVLGIALPFGLTIFALAYTIGHISGGHINPAITFAFVVAGKISIFRGGLYFLAQLFGSVLGGVLLIGLMPSETKASCFAANVLAENIGIGMVLGWEILLSFFLLFVVGAAADTEKSNTVLVPFAIGMAITVCHFVAVPLDGCGINPTRSFASAVAASSQAGCSHVWNTHWIFWIGPLIGAPCGLLTYALVSSSALGAIDHARQNLVNMYRRRTSLVSEGANVPVATDTAGPQEKPVTHAWPQENPTTHEKPATHEKSKSPRPTDLEKMGEFRN